jgi:methylmalonyl-CoA mutase N-terminal domain/subunit
VTKTVDPFAGSYAIESLTDEVEEAAQTLMKAVEDRGGAVEAIEQGFQKTEIEKSAYQVAQQIDSGERTVVGVNKFVTNGEEPYEPLKVDPRIEADQCERLSVLRKERDNQSVARALDALKRAAEGTDNILPPMREALKLRATGGEVAHALRAVWGVYQPSDSF